MKHLFLIEEMGCTYLFGVCEKAGLIPEYAGVLVGIVLAFGIDMVYKSEENER